MKDARESTIARRVKTGQPPIKDKISLSKKKDCSLSSVMTRTLRHGLGPTRNSTEAAVKVRISNRGGKGITVSSV